MSKRNRIFLGIVGLFALAVSLLLYRIATDFDSRYRESTEESVVDTAYLLAAFIETDLRGAQVDGARLRTALERAYTRRFAAQIYAITKRRIDLRVYLTDANGTVLFDSEHQAEGKDFRSWRDVSLTLAGEYGARTTLTDPLQPDSAIMYVAAPIIDDGRIVGVVSVGKPVASQQELVATARQKLLYVGLITLAAFLFLLLVLSVWLARPFGLTADLIRVLRQEGVRHPARVARRVRAVLTSAFGDMRDALAGRSHTEEYVQTLTHELKSPLTAIRGAAELLREPLPTEHRERFAGNISEQVTRLQNLADRLLELASLEKRRTLDEVQAVDLVALMQQVRSAMESTALLKQIVLQVDPSEPLRVEGDPFLLYQALLNLVANAIDFSPPQGSIALTVSSVGRRAELRVRDYGPGVPDYALDRIFEKFYSLRRPDSGRKSTGLGLAFVREIAHLHGGESYLINQPDGGTAAIISLPQAPAGK